MRRLVRAAAVAALMLLWAVPAQASDPSLTGGCTLQLASFDGAGKPLDTATLPGGDVGSASNPFDVAWDGRVDFRFTTGTTVFQNNTWAVSVESVPVPVLKGSDDNPIDLDESGTVTIGQEFPSALHFVGDLQVSGYISGNAGKSRCDGSGWVRVLGNPVGTIPWDVFVGLIVVGGLFLIATPFTKDWEEGGHSPMPTGGGATLR